MSTYWQNKYMQFLTTQGLQQYVYPSWCLHKLMGIYMGGQQQALYISTWFLLLLAVFIGPKELRSGLGSICQLVGGTPVSVRTCNF